MIRLPVTAATLIAIVHMAIGCAWHHGISGQGGCHGVCATQVDTGTCSGCPGQPGSHNSELRSPVSAALKPCPPGSSASVWFGHPGSDHIPCIDDRCTFTRPDAVDVNDSSELAAQGLPDWCWLSPAVTRGPMNVVATCSMRGLHPPNLRAHLFLSVLTL